MAISSSWRGTVGIIKPTLRVGGVEEFCRLLPEGIGVLPLFVNIHKGTCHAAQYTPRIKAEASRE